VDPSESDRSRGKTDQFAHQADGTVPSTVLNQPAIGIDATAREADIDTVVETARQATEHDAHVLVAAGAGDVRLLSQLRELDLTVLEIEDHAGVDVQREFCFVGKKLGVPGVLVHPSPGDRLCYEESYAAFREASAYVVPARVSGTDAETNVIAGVLAPTDGRGLQTVVNGASEYADEVVVAGGPGDGEIRQEAGVTIVDVESDARGTAARALFEHVDLHYADIEALVMVDGDGEYDPAWIPALTDALADEDADVAVGQDGTIDSRPGAGSRAAAGLRESLTLGSAEQADTPLYRGVQALSAAAVSQLTVGDGVDDVGAAIIDGAIRADLGVTVTELDADGESTEGTHRRGQSLDESDEAGNALSPVPDEVVAALGVATLTVVAVAVANHPLVQQWFALVPFLGNPAPAVLSAQDLVLAVTTTLVVVLAALWPLYKPRPRRILDTILLVQKRVVIATVGLAALGYFNWSYRLPRSTLMLASVALFVTVPAWFLFVRQSPGAPSRAVLVGDDPQAMQDILAATDLPVEGYVAPPASFATAAALQTASDGAAPVSISDGGTPRPDLEELSCLGGLSRLAEVFVDHDPDTALLAFTDADRGDFFGTLETCHDHGVTAMVHREHADDVLTAERAGGELLEVDLEPWNWQDYLVKRVFDVAFAVVGLLVLSPVILAIATAIKLDSPGPVLYSHDRTAAFGEMFPVYKFRSMVPNAERETGVTLSAEDRGGRDPRVTRVGRVLRTTHLDEIPQLWSILVGDMSAVGPRPERPELDTEMESSAEDWRRRWFIKPGLTGLAQINDATGHDPDEKLRYDVEYIRRQSVWFDVKIVIRQVWQVLGDLVGFLADRNDRGT